MTKLTNLLTSGMNCWGPTIPITPSAHSCSRVELYEENAIWRQSSCQVLQEDPMRPLRDMITELVPDWDARIPDLALIKTKEEAQEAAEIYQGPSRLGDMLARVACGESVETMLERTARDMVAVGYLGAEVLRWAEAQATYSLLVNFEHLPVALAPQGSRGERSAALMGLVRHIGLEKVVTPRKVLEAWDGLHGRQFHLVKEEMTHTEQRVTRETKEKVAGRMIWDPWPFLVLHTPEDLETLISRIPGMVTLQEMTVHKDPDGTEILLPRPFNQVRVLASKLIHRGTIPLEILNGVPTAERMAAHFRKVMNTPFEQVWKSVLEAMEKPYLFQSKARFWVLLP